jgi:CheY-like chemotaxis protein
MRGGIMLRVVKRHVLIVDDDAANRALVKRNVLLAFHAVEVLEACDGMEGLMLFLENYETIVAIISDINMPKIRGTEMAERIRAIKNDAVIIMMSSCIHPNDHDVVFGMSAYFSKNMENKDIVRLLSRFK